MVSIDKTGRSSLDGKVAQLQSLRIDEKDRKSSVSWQARIAAAVAGVVIIALAANFVVSGNALPPEEGPSGADARIAVAGPQTPEDGSSEATPSAPPSTGIVASGFVEARRTVAVTAEVVARVAGVAVEEGDVVEAGQELAVLDDRGARADLAVLQARHRAAAAALNVLRSEYRDAQRRLERSRNLSEDGVLPQASLQDDEAEAERLRNKVAQARADLDTAEAEMAVAALELERYRIVTPIAGTVTEVTARVGELVGGGTGRPQSSFTVIDMDSLEVEVDVNEALVSKVHAGQPVRLTVDAYPRQPFEGRVIGLASAVERESASVRVRIEILDQDPRILPAMAVKAAFAEEVQADG